MPLTYYFSKSSYNHLPQLHEISSGDYALGGGTTLPEPNKETLDGLYRDHERVWLVLSYNDFNWLHRKNQWIEVEDELNKYYVIVKDKRLDQIELKLYQRKKDYRI